MSAVVDRLRRAADRIEQCAAETQHYAADPWSGLVRESLVPWVALMSPDLAGPLAAWLRGGADRMVEHIGHLENYRPDPVVDFGDEQRPQWTTEEIAANVAHHWRHELALADVIMNQSERLR